MIFAPLTDYGFKTKLKMKILKLKRSTFGGVTHVRFDPFMLRKGDRPPPKASGCNNHIFFTGHQFEGGMECFMLFEYDENTLFTVVVE